MNHQKIEIHPNICPACGQAIPQKNTGKIEVHQGILNLPPELAEYRDNPLDKKKSSDIDISNVRYKLGPQYLEKEDDDA